MYYMRPVWDAADNYVQNGLSEDDWAYDAEGPKKQWHRSYQYENYPQHIVAVPVVMH